MNRSCQSALCQVDNPAQTCHRSISYQVKMVDGSVMDYCRYHFRKTLLPEPPAQEPDLRVLAEQLGTIG